MINTHAKGNKNQLLCIKELIKQGYIIEFKSFANMYHDVDYKNLFDVVALKKKEHRIYIQVKTNHCYDGIVIECLKAYKNEYALSSDIIELWDRYDCKYATEYWEIKHKKNCSLEDKYKKQKRKPVIKFCPECFRKYKEKKKKLSPHWKITRF
jgi:hypothetical protein